MLVIFTLLTIEVPGDSLRSSRAMTVSGKYSLVGLNLGEEDKTRTTHIPTLLILFRNQTVIYSSRRRSGTKVFGPCILDEWERTAPHLDCGSWWHWHYHHWHTSATRGPIWTHIQVYINNLQAIIKPLSKWVLRFSGFRVSIHWPLWTIR